MICPKCREEDGQQKLLRNQVNGVSVFVCSRCHGNLVELRNVTKIEKRIRKDIMKLIREVRMTTQSDLTEQIRCPRCRSQMKKKFIDKLVCHLDECTNCSFVWFDGGELARLQLAYESREQTQELNQMRSRLENMTDHERAIYEKRIASLPSPNTILMDVLRELADSRENPYSLWFNSRFE